MIIDKFYCNSTTYTIAEDLVQNRLFFKHLFDLTHLIEQGLRENSFFFRIARLALKPTTHMTFLRSH